MCTIVYFIPNRQIQMYFNDRPKKPIIDMLKANGFDYPDKNTWTIKQTKANIYTACEIKTSYEFLLKELREKRKQQIQRENKAKAKRKAAREKQKIVS